MNVVNFQDFKTKKELEKFTEALFKQCLKLRQENDELKDKIEELESLLEMSLLTKKDKV